MLILMWLLLIPVALVTSFFFLYRRTIRGRRRLQLATRPFIFKEPTGRRWATLLFGFGFSVMVLTVAGFMLFGLIVTEDAAVHIPLTSVKQSLPSSAFEESKRFVKQQMDVLEAESEPINIRTGSQQQPSKRTNFAFTAFYLSDNEDSEFSLRAHIKHIDTVIPTWYTLQSEQRIIDRREPDIDRFVLTSGKRLVPLINNNINGKWDGEIVHRVLVDSRKRSWLIEQLYSFVEQHGYHGVNIDFENLRPTDRELFTGFIRELSARFKPKQWEVSVDVAFDAPVYDFSQLNKYADEVYMMAYDEHYSTGAPGPIASTDWIERALSVAGLDPQKTVVALGNYGYNWQANERGASELTYDEAVALLTDFGGTFKWNDTASNPSIEYKNGGQAYVAWYLDAISFYNQMKFAGERNFYKFALWRLGAEDASLWSVIEQLQAGERFADSAESIDVSRLRTLKNVNAAHIEGVGEIFSLAGAPKPGTRTWKLDNQRSLYDVDITELPSSVRLKRTGPPNEKKQVVLSFDDGPSDRATPAILDILRREKIKATFFMIGSNTLKHPLIARSVVREGHEVGNHTFLHPNFSKTNQLNRTALELNATQFAVKAVSGYSTVLFRPPYTPNVEDASRRELLHILESMNRGYVTVNANIDSKDWLETKAGKVVDNVRKQLKEKKGNIILLHDDGPNVDITLQALPQIIRTLKQEKYQFVTVSEWLQIDRDRLMPPLAKAERVGLLPFAWLMPLGHFLLSILTVVFIVGIVIGVFRLLLLIVFARRQRNRPHVAASDGVTDANLPFVSVVVAAYNEETVIANSVNALLLSNYPNFELIIVDDGSTDRTWEILRADFGGQSNIELMTHLNAGKSYSVNKAIEKARGEVVVCLDADTMVMPDTLRRLCEHFCDPLVGAVAGNIKVGNPDNWLTACQHIEYVTGLNLEKRAFDALNCITVVPGAIGAWRKQLIVDAGLFSEETMAEDTDLTMKLVSENARILYEPHAPAYTEAPSTISGLVRQRVRWSFGILQCAWKYRRHMFSIRNPSFSLVALPGLWIFHLFFQLLVPVGELLLLTGLLFGVIGTFNAGLLYYYVAFLLVELAITALAFRFEGQRFFRIDQFIIQKIVYRPLIAYCVIVSVIAAFRGAGISWNKLDRVGTVEVPPQISKKIDVSA